jgi:hypothetical protein
MAHSTMVCRSPDWDHSISSPLLNNLMTAPAYEATYQCMQDTGQESMAAWMCSSSSNLGSQEGATATDTSVWPDWHDGAGQWLLM